MKKSMAAAILIAGLAFAACSDDDGVSGGGNSDAAKEVAKQLVDEAKANGVLLDETCVAGIADSLSDEDAAAILAAGPGGKPEVSSEGQDLAVGILACFGDDQLVDQLIQGIVDSGDQVDEDCVRKNLEEFDIGELARSDADLPTEVVAAIEVCLIGP